MAKKTVNPEFIFQQAIGYHFASQLGLKALAADAERFIEGKPVQTEGPTGYLFVPVCVLQAFACELYLKALILNQTNIDPPWEHDLVQLFELLPGETKIMIEMMDDLSFSQSPPVQQLAAVRGGRKPFKDRLDSSRHAFQALRYIYDPNPKYKVSWEGTTIVDALNRTCLMLNERWGAELGQIPPKA